MTTDIPFPKALFEPEDARLDLVGSMESEIDRAEARAKRKADLPAETQEPEPADQMGAILRCEECGHPTEYKMVRVPPAAEYGPPADAPVLYRVSARGLSCELAVAYELARSPGFYLIDFLAEKAESVFEEGGGGHDCPEALVGAGRGLLSVVNDPRRATDREGGAA